MLDVITISRLYFNNKSTLFFSSRHVVSDVEKDFLRNGKYTELLQHQEMMGKKQEEIVSTIYYTLFNTK